MSGRDTVAGMPKRIRVTFCGAGNPAGTVRSIVVTATTTETAPGVYAVDPASIVLDMSGNGAPIAMRPAGRVRLR